MKITISGADRRGRQYRDYYFFKSEKLGDVHIFLNRKRREILVGAKKTYRSFCVSIPIDLFFGDKKEVEITKDFIEEQLTVYSTMLKEEGSVTSDFDQDPDGVFRDVDNSIYHQTELQEYVDAVDAIIDILEEKGYNIEDFNRACAIGGKLKIKES